MNPRRPSSGPPAVLRLALVLLLLFLNACGREGPDTDRLAFQAFGTLVDVTLHPAGAHDLQQVESALREDFEAMHASWHAWEPGPLTDTNRLLAGGTGFDAPASVLPLIEQARELEQRTDGLFNPALGRLIAAWGFHHDEPAGPPPSDATLAALLADPPRIADIEYDGERLRGTHPALQLDFGGLAKGLAVARSLELLAELGVEHAIVNAGGDLMTLGQPAGRPWRIGVRDPRGAAVLAAIALGADEALFSSGDYERGYEWDGKRIHHVIDPRTGKPSEGVASATVLHAEPALADAAATTLMIAGPEAWPAYAHRLGVDHALLVLADGSVELTPAMENRVDFRRDLEYRLREPGSDNGREPR